MDQDNTRYIAEQIFNNPPGHPNSIDLQLDDSTLDFARNQEYESDKLIRDILSVITLHGVEILYGHRNIMLLNEESVLLLKRFTRSYGYDLNINIQDTTITISFEKCYDDSSHVPYIY